MSMIAELAVARTAEMHPKQVGVTLHLIDGVTTQFYASAYIFPDEVTSGLGRESAADATATIYLHRQGEQYEPRADDWITDPSFTWNISSVAVSSDYQPNTAVYTLRVVRKA